jgi:hypothetical protein
MPTEAYALCPRRPMPYARRVPHVTEKGYKILATYERVAVEKQEGQIAEAVNSRPWSQGIN